MSMMCFFFVFNKRSFILTNKRPRSRTESNPMEAGVLLIFYAAIAEFIDEGFLK